MEAGKPIPKMKPAQKRKRKEEEEEEKTDKLKLKKIKYEQTLKNKTHCSSIADWIYYLAYGSLVSAVTDCTPVVDEERNFRWWWKDALNAFCFDHGINKSELKKMLCEMENEIITLVTHAATAYRGLTSTCSSLTYVGHWVKMAMRRVMGAMMGLDYRSVPGILFWIPSLGVYAHTHVEWDEEVQEHFVKSPYLGRKKPLQNPYAVPLTSELYSVWKNTKAHIFIHSAILHLVEGTKEFSSLAESDCRESVCGESEPVAEEEEEEDGGVADTTTAQEPPPDTSCPSYFGETHELREAADEVQEAICRTDRLIKRLEKLADVNFVLGLDEDGEEVIEPEKRKIVKGHAVYFAAVSPWFQRMLDGAMLEARKEVKVEGGTVCVQANIQLPTVSPCIFKAIQMWAYGGGFAAAVEVANEELPQLVDVALSLELNKLFELCLDYFGDNQLNFKGICHLTEFVYMRLFHREYSEVYAEKFRNLYYRCIDYISNHFVDLCIETGPPEQSFRSCSSRETYLQLVKVRLSKEAEDNNEDKDEGVIMPAEMSDTPCYLGVPTEKGVHMEWFPLDLMETILERVRSDYETLIARVEPAALLLILRWCMVQGWKHFAKLVKYVRLQFLCPRFLLRHMDLLQFDKSCSCLVKKPSEVYDLLDRNCCCFFYHTDFYTEAELKELVKVETKVRKQVRAALNIQHGIQRQAESTGLERRLIRFLKKTNIYTTPHKRCECNTSHTSHILELNKKHEYPAFIQNYTEALAIAPCCLFYDLYHYMTSEETRLENCCLYSTADGVNFESKLCDEGIALLLGMQAANDEDGAMEVAGS